MASEQEKRLRRHSKVVLSRCSKLLEELLDKTPSIERLQLAIEEFEVKLTNYDEHQSVIELSMISEVEIEKEVEDGSKYREEKIDVLCKAKKLFEELNCASEKKKAEKTESVVKSEAAGTSCVRAFLCTTASHDPEPKFQDDKPAEARTYYSSDCNGQTATLRQCVKTPLNGLDIHILFDSGCDRSFITTSAAKKLQLKCVGEDRISFSAFEGKNGTKTCLIYELNVKGECIKLHAIDTICAPMVRQKVPESIIKGFDFPLYENLGKDDTIKIEILIGLD